MSALGHKQTRAVQKGMSALLPKATVKADMLLRRCARRPTSKRDWPIKIMFPRDGQTAKPHLGQKRSRPNVSATALHVSASCDGRVVRSGQRRR